MFDERSQIVCSGPVPLAELAKMVHGHLAVVIIISRKWEVVIKCATAAFKYVMESIYTVATAINLISFVRPHTSKKNKGAFLGNNVKDGGINVVMMLNF